MPKARSLVRLAPLALVAVLALVGVTGAAAAPPAPASGTFTTTSANLANPRSDGGNTIFDLTATVAYTGTFNGASIVRGTLIFHPDGSAEFHDVETFTGTVNGAAGTVIFNLAGTGSVAPPAGAYQGTQAIVAGTGALANLHGTLEQVGAVPSQAIGPLGTYTGRIHFDP